MSEFLTNCPCCSSSTSSSSSSSGISTICCPGVTLPTTLYATVSVACGGGSYTLTYDGIGAWNTLGSLTICGKNFNLTFTCYGPPNGFGFVGSCDVDTIGGFQTSLTCDPFSVTMTGTVSFGACAGPISVTVTP